MFEVIVPQKPYKIEINLDKFPIRRCYANFVTETVEVTPGFYRLTVFCLLRAEEPLEYAYGMALLSEHVFSLAELEEIAYTEAVMQLIWFYVSGLPSALPGASGRDHPGPVPGRATAGASGAADAAGEAGAVERGGGVPCLRLCVRIRRR